MEWKRGGKMRKKALVVAVVAIAVVAIFVVFVEKENVISPAPTPSEPMRGRNILMVIAPEDFRDEELFEPKEIFEKKGAEVTIASTTTEMAKGMFGRTIKPDLRISDVNVEDYDAIVIVGGAGSKEYLWDDKELRAMVKEAYNKNKVLAAICLSPVVLAKAGILDGKKATVFPHKEAIDELKKNGAYYVDENVVVSDNVITGRDTESTEEFSLKICDALLSHEEMEGNQ
ncbi:MAG: DJ-1/PfpI family protein [Canidatus Methanoxibalbensis ujae]|nr:DJ-1/PfpI family protein [Candidatus Methanoxibalbensis ujae]MCW7078559.1 DJ-1/PfpI family protein [Candidatus Methanoxibalbensis ujae]